MEVQTIGATLSSTESQVKKTSLGQEDLFKILLTQLTFQDPLKPLDNQEFVARLAQFTSLEQSRDLNDKMDYLVAMESVNQSVGLLGKTVQVDGQGQSVVGEITTIRFERGTPLLTIKTASGEFVTDIALGQIALVRP